ncbi:MAG2960 family serine endopeptidase lipoprotein [Metamycoplasma hyosynoviae]|uniref:MAG2960 family serine endopeptidase lipoprotein n=1 Tax=Metamycoplasma hyosynoviae TaxID=29559 RepID=UPI0023664B20|nr:hypothetical protein [Metamycoplasma hyosynoviae]MDD7847453.1 hypothetical protein [Metamycoplasma hyosynoviae]MDD7894032.1 hypothetical protein [Metamycoplasma hyosynoviae]
MKKGIFLKLAGCLPLLVTPLFSLSCNNSKSEQNNKDNKDGEKSPLLASPQQNIIKHKLNNIASKLILDYKDKSSIYVEDAKAEVSQLDYSLELDYELIINSIKRDLQNSTIEIEYYLNHKKENIKSNLYTALITGFKSKTVIQNPNLSTTNQQPLHKTVEDLNNIAKSISFDYEGKNTILAKDAINNKSNLKYYLDSQYLVKKLWLTLNGETSIKVHFQISEKNGSITSSFQEFIINGFKLENNIPIVNSNYDFSGKTYYSKDVYSDLFKSEHIFNREDFKNNSIHDVWQKSPLYKVKLNNFLWTLKNYNGQGINFLTSSGPSESRKYYEELEDVGVFGEYGDSDREKVQYFNPYFSSEYITKQKYLSNFNSNESSSASLHNLTEDIVKDNPFGFLPSNLSQYLYMLKIEDIEKLLKVDFIASLKMNFDDKAGTGEILVVKKDNSKVLIKIDASNQKSLKKDADFYDYIYQRTISIGTNYLKWNKHPYTHSSTIENSGMWGTAWILDRIENKELEKEEQYEFLAATNIHVLTYNDIFDKSKYFYDTEIHNENNEMSKNWNGGLASFYPSNDIIKTFQKSNNPHITYQTLTRRKKDYLAGWNIWRANAANGEQALGMASKKATFSNIKDRYTDVFWYTPRFKSSGLYFIRQIHEKYLNKFDNSRIGSTDNGGMDLVIFKLRLDKSQIAFAFPQLHSILNTSKEKDWYIGVGQNQKFSPYQTQFIAGYPYQEYTSTFNFKGQKSQGGTIVTRNRFLSEDPWIQSLWVKYNEQENKDWNKLNDNWKKYEKKFRDDHLHGMKKEIIVQSSYLNTYTNNEHVLHGGSSGSMAIDSRFNLIGINFLQTSSNEVDNYGKSKYVTNGVALFNSHIEHEDFSGSIRDEIIEKLKSENIKTIKLNPQH